MLERTAVACYVLSATAVAVTGSVFPEMRSWSGALLLVALLQAARLFVSRLAALAATLAGITSAVALAAVLLSLLPGTIGGSFHIDEDIQPVLWSLAGISASGALILATRR